VVVAVAVVELETADDDAPSASCGRRDELETNGDPDACELADGPSEDFWLESSNGEDEPVGRLDDNWRLLFGEVWTVGDEDWMTVDVCSDDVVVDLSCEVDVTVDTGETDGVLFEDGREENVVVITGKRVVAFDVEYIVLVDANDDVVYSSKALDTVDPALPTADTERNVDLCAVQNCAGLCA
jgi:hypothetical protein